MPKVFNMVVYRLASRLVRQHLSTDHRNTCVQNLQTPSRSVLFDNTCSCMAISSLLEMKGVRAIIKGLARSSNNNPMLRAVFR